MNELSPPVEAIVLDLDGTLLNSSRRVSPTNLAAILGCHRQGIHIIIATARPPRAVHRLLPPSLLTLGYLVYYNGALITHPGLGFREHHAIPAGIAQRMAGFLMGREPSAVLTYEVDDRWYSLSPLSAEEGAVFGVGNGDKFPEVLAADEFWTIAPTKMVVSRFRLWRELAAEFPDHAHVVATDGGQLIQIMARSVSKDLAVHRVLANLQIAPAAAMVFGDDHNDAGLFSLCGFPVAMANAVPELKRVAWFETTSNDGDGVAVAINRFILT